jgi:hypothetical protein
MIFKTIQPDELQRGDRVVYLGHVETIHEVIPARDGGCYAMFVGREAAHFVEPVMAVDETRTAALLARYS